MFISLEPGYYRAGKFGIRLENLAVIVKNDELSTAEQTYFRFEIVTLCPFARELILNELLTAAEKTCLDTYHQRVYTSLAPHLADAEQAWLKAATAPL
jgi:Xaa-Pro aminopeptidase